MTIHEILAQPVWRSLAQKPGFAALPAPAIVTANCFFDFIVRHHLPAPTAGDIRWWLEEMDIATRPLHLDQLQAVFEVCQPSFLPAIRDASRLSTPPRNPEKATAADSDFKNQDSRFDMAHARQDWDPIARPTRKAPRARQVSIPPWKLPNTYQVALRRAADGLPGQEPGMRVPAREIVKRMREKLCQHAWSAGRHHQEPFLSLASIDTYFTDLKERLSLRPAGLRWATLRASAEALYVFARYSGSPADIQQHLSGYYREYESREAGQKALKFFALLRTGNSTDRILNLADNLLAGVAAEERPKKRHQMRNGAAILAIFANAPLRNASAQLVFGATLLWENEEWVIRTKIQKTHLARPEILNLPLHREVGRFADALILGDASDAMLPVLRQNAINSRRQVFVLPDGTPAASTYIPRIFHALTGNSFTTLRIMHYSDAIGHHGVEGIEMAKPAAHHASTDIVKKHYIAEEVSKIHATNLRSRRSKRLENSREEHGNVISAIKSMTIAGQ